MKEQPEHIENDSQIVEMASNQVGRAARIVLTEYAAGRRTREEVIQAINEQIGVSLTAIDQRGA